MEAAAASIAFVQITTDIVKCVVKARRLWQEVKDVPDEIQEMLSDMDDLGTMFNGIKHQLESNNSSLSQDDPSVTRSLDIATQACDGLTKLIKDMSTQINSKNGMKKKAAALKVTMKKEHLDQYQQRLFRLINRLQLSAQFYNIALTSRTPELISRRVTTDLTTYMDRRQVETPKLISRLVTADLTTYMDTRHTKQRPVFSYDEEQDEETYMDTQKTKQRPLYPYGDEYTQEGWVRKSKPVIRMVKPVAKTRTSSSFKFGNFVLEYTKDTGVWQACIQWPGWLSQSIYELVSISSPSGWMCHYRVYNIVPHESEIIRKVRAGDMNGVLELFSTRKASPFDKDPSGRSLLYYAAGQGSRNYDICKLLLRMGLDECLVMPPESRVGCPLVSLIQTGLRGPVGETEETRRKQIVGLFNSYMDGRESDLILKAFDFVVDHEYDRGSVTSFRKNFLPTLHTSPLRYRLEAFRLGSFHMNTEAGLETFLSEDGRVPPGDVNQSTREKLSLVHSVALALGIRYADKIVFPHNNFPVCSVYHEFWSDLVQDIASAAGQEDLHCIETVVPWDVYHVPAWTGTPLISAIGGALCYMSPDIEFDHWDEVFQKTVQKWVLDLQNAGVDLAEYGCREALAVEQTRGALDADAIVKSRTLIRHVMKEGPRTSRPGPEDMRRWNETHWVPIRLLGLNVGPQPKDWRLMWAPEFEWMAQQFWTLVEKGDTVMPGSWVES